MNSNSPRVIAIIFASLCAAPVIAADSEQPISDSVITTKVKAELAKDSTTDAAKIHVKTQNGVVHLTGVVASTAEKSQASKDAQMIDGVGKVKNDLQVKP